MNSKTYRLREFITPADGRSLVVDASAGLTMGALPGLEDFAAAASTALPLADGLVAAPGQARRLTMRTRDDAALLVRANWTNALRGADFVLPPEKTAYIPLITPLDASDLGASALVLDFLLGHDEQVEADCLRLSVQFALEGSTAGIPFIIDVQPVGPRVRWFDKAVELGVSYALEAGADGIAVPWPGEQSFETITAMAAEVPVWVKPTDLDSAGSELASTLGLGGVGLWLGADVFADPDTAGMLTAFSGQVHAGERV